MQRLRQAGEQLRTRPPRETLLALCKTLDAWSAPASSHQQDLVEDLARDGLFSEPVLREGLALGLADWTGDALRAVVERELGSIDRLQATGSTRVCGFELTATILAGAIPMPTLISILLPLVLQSPVLVKTSQRDRKTAEHVKRSIAAVDPGLGECVEILSTTREDKASTLQLLTAPCVVAMGSDATLEELSQHVRASQRWVGYGHRLSLAILGPNARLSSQFEETTARLAQDIAAWDQGGCLSPAAVFTIGDPADAAEVAMSLAQAMEQQGREWPRGKIEKSTAASIHHEREEARMRAAAGQAVSVHASSDTSWTVIAEANAEWRTAPLHRFVRIYPVASLHALETAIRPLGPYLSTVSLDGFSTDNDSVTDILVRTGASRICPTGKMQTPPLGWHHDGRPLLLPLARFCDDEQE